MGILCWLAGHAWNDTCRCTRCARVRDEGHSWNGCCCSTCGREKHEWGERSPKEVSHTEGFRVIPNDRGGYRNARLQPVTIVTRVFDKKCQACGKSVSETEQEYLEP
jgi:hypothetical protein